MRGSRALLSPGAAGCCQALACRATPAALLCCSRTCIAASCLAASRLPGGPSLPKAAARWPWQPPRQQRSYTSRIPCSGTTPHSCHPQDGQRRQAQQQQALELLQAELEACALGPSALRDRYVQGLMARLREAEWKVALALRREATWGFRSMVPRGRWGG
jgi:hypothetical protein